MLNAHLLAQRHFNINLQTSHKHAHIGSSVGCALSDTRLNLAGNAQFTLGGEKMNLQTFPKHAYSIIDNQIESQGHPQTFKTAAAMGV